MNFIYVYKLFGASYLYQIDSTWKCRTYLDVTRLSWINFQLSSISRPQDYAWVRAYLQLSYVLTSADEFSIGECQFSRNFKNSLSARFLDSINDIEHESIFLTKKIVIFNMLSGKLIFIVIEIFARQENSD